MTQRPTARISTLALALLALIANGASATAQVAVLRIDPEAEQVCRDVETALRDADLAPDPGYLSQAREQGVEPTAAASLELITPLLQLELAIVPLYVDDRSIQLEYRDGRTGTRLGTATIPHDRGKLGRRGRAQLQREVAALLTQVRGSAGAQPEAASAEAHSEIGEREGREPDTAGQGETEDASRAVRIHIHAGIGLGTREVEWTAHGRAERVELGAFPSFDLGLSFSFRLSRAISLAPRLEYQSSLAFHEVEEARMAAPAERTGVRAHRFAAVLALPILLDGERSAWLAPALGVGVWNLRPEVHHLSTPAYSLAGPLAQVALVVPLGQVFAVRVQPEAQWLVVGEGLRQREVHDSGVSLGCELAVRVVVMPALSLELSYRQAHAVLSSTEGNAADVERFATVRAVATL